MPSSPPNSLYLRGASLLIAVGMSAQAHCANANPKVAATPTVTAARSGDRAMLTARQQDLDALIKELIAFRALGKKQLILRIEATPAQVESLDYQRLHNLTTVQNRAKHPATFSFHGEQSVLILLSDPAVLERFSIADLRALLAGQPVELRSRLGKTSSLYVYAELGLAFASRRNDSSKIQYVEVFQPQPIESYKSTIYQDPETLLPQ